jgi:hypothetical protein
MPRRSIDQTIEHRISLGNYERDVIERVISLQKENQRLDALTATLQAGGTAVAGLGLGWAAITLGAFLIPNVGEKVMDAAKDGLDAIADTVLPKNPVELRREAQRLAARRGEINAKIDRFCVASSPDYDAAQCSIAHDEKDTYFEEVEIFRAAVTAANIENDSFYWRFIFGGLGDIEPDVGDKGTNMSWWEYFLNFSL